jgi:hypothetical protein
LNTGVADVLSGVSCSSRSVCTAVGSYYRISPWPGVGVPVVLRWTAGKLSAQSPVTGGFPSVVSCVSYSACTAVGSTVMRWNGVTWDTEPVPAIPGSVSLTGVSCVSATACVAVGTVATRSQNVEYWAPLVLSSMTPASPGSRPQAVSVRPHPHPSDGSRSNPVRRSRARPPSESAAREAVGAGSFW